MLKGTATIELTNVKTGEVERYTEENMVTNAVNDILTLNPLGLRCCNTGTQISMIPVRGNAIGGVLLCENTLEEDPDKYYVPNDNVIVGYANTAVNTTEDPKRGSGNQAEQGMTEDKKGYKFVFDFATSQGNGTISSVGLTGYNAGSVGRGSKYSNENALYNTTCCSSSTTLSAFETVSKFYPMEWLTAFDLDKNQMISVRLDRAKKIRLWRMSAALTSIGVNDSVTVNPGTNRVIEETVIETSTFGNVTSLTGTSNISVYGAFVNDGNGYIWGFEHANNASGNKTGNATVNWIKIKIDDFTFEEGTWTLAAQIWPFGTSYYHEYGSAGVWNAHTVPQQSHYRITNCCIHRGYLYCFAYNKTGVYKIELANPSNVLLMEHPGGACITANIPDHATSYYVLRTSVGMNVRGDDVFFTNGVVENGKILATCSSTPSYTYSEWTQSYFYGTPYGLVGVQAPCLSVGPFIIKYLVGNYRYSSNNPERIYRTSLLANNLYLATINNLSKPVQKTADKTMKITYIIREEE